MKNKAYLMAERMGFEPMKDAPLHAFKRAPSTTRPPLHKFT